MQIHRSTDDVSGAVLGSPDVDRLVLYADAADGVSDSIYRQVGYAPCEEHVEIRFTTVP